MIYKKKKGKEELYLVKSYMIELTRRKVMGCRVK